MPSLLDTLTSSFGSGGFDLHTAVGGLGDATGAVSPTGVSLDQGTLGQIGQRVGGGGFGAIGSSVTGVLGQASGIAGGLPQPGTLLQPLSGALSTASSFVAADPRDVLQLFEQATATRQGELGMAALAGPLSALSSVRSNPLIATVLKLLSGVIPGGIPLDQTITRLGDEAIGIAAAVRLLGALMSTEALAREIATSAATIGGMLDEGVADAALMQLGTATGSGLAELIAGASPDDATEAASIVPQVAAFADSIRLASDRIVSGMAFGEASLVGADLGSVADGLTQAARLLDEATLLKVRSLATEVAGWIEPILRIDLGTPAASVDAFVGELTGLVGQLAAAIDKLDPAARAQPVKNGLATAVAPLHEVENLANQATAAIRSALQTAQQAISSIDLRPVTDAIQSAVQPAIDALHDLDQLVGAAESDLETLANDVKTSLDTLRQTLDAAAQTIHDAFAGVGTVVDGLHLDDLQATIQQELQAVTSALDSAHVKPYFDTAVQALDAAKGVVAAVPVSLLPDDTKKELDDAVKPIKEIDFDSDVRDVLEQQLDAILTSLDTDALNEVEQAYQEVVAFIKSIDPRPPLQQFEQDDFDPMLDRIRAVDPTEILKPVSDVIDQLKAAVANIDLRKDVLGPVEDAFDELEQGLAKLDPTEMLKPLEDEVGVVRDEIAKALQLDVWQARLALVDPFVEALLAKLDFATLAALLDAAWGELEPAPDPSGTSALATLVSGLLEGTGLTVRMDSFATVARWLGGADASAEVTSRLAAAADAVDGTVAVVGRLDPKALVAATQPAYTAVTAAVAALPEGSLLRGQLEPVFGGPSPLDVLGAAVDNRDRYLASLTALSTLVRGQASSARSELNAIAQGLRDALRPLTAIADRVKALFARIGLDVTGKSLRQLVRDLFDQFTPSRILGPIGPAIAALAAKVAAFVHDALVAPLTDALTTVHDTLAALDISFIRTSLQAVYDQIAADIHALRPSVVLAGVLDAFDQAKATIAAFDPLAPVRQAIDAMKAAIDDVAQHYRPTALFAPLFGVYDEIAHALGNLDVKKLLDPVLKALADIKAQLDDGLDSTAAALKQLQGVLP